MPTPVILPTYSIGSWSANVDDDLGCRWVIAPGGASIATDGVGRKTHTLERPFGPGAYRSRSYLTARTGVLQGWMDAGGNRVARVAARDRLMALFAGGGTAVLTVDDGIAPRQITVELAADVPKCAVWEDGGGFDWQLSLYAADPRFLSAEVMYSAALPGGASTDGLNWSVGGSGGGLDWAAGSPGGLDWGTSGSGVNVLTMTNPGSAPTWPLLTFTSTATLTNPLLTDPATSRVLSYLGDIVAGQTLRVDCSPFTRSVTLDGVDRSGALGLAQWPEIAPGQTLNLQLTGTGTGTCIAAWQAANL